MHRPAAKEGAPFQVGENPAVGQHSVTGPAIVHLWYVAPWPQVNWAGGVTEDTRSHDLMTLDYEPLQTPKYFFQLDTSLSMGAYIWLTVRVVVGAHVYYVTEQNGRLLCIIINNIAVGQPFLRMCGPGRGLEEEEFT